MDIVKFQFQTREKQYFYIVHLQYTPDSQIPVFPVSRNKTEILKNLVVAKSARRGILIHPWVRFYLSLRGGVTISIALTSKPYTRMSPVSLILGTFICIKYIFMMLYVKCRNLYFNCWFCTPSTPTYLFLYYPSSAYHSLSCSVELVNISSCLMCIFLLYIVVDELCVIERLIYMLLPLSIFRCYCLKHIQPQRLQNNR